MSTAVTVTPFRAFAALVPLVAFGCGSVDSNVIDPDTEQVGDVGAPVTATVPNHPWFPSAPVTSEDWDGSQYSVMIEGGGTACSGQMINRHYAITSGHCFNSTVQNARIYRAGAITNNDNNAVQIWTGTFQVYEPVRASCDSKRDFAILALQPGTPNAATCQSDGADCLANLWWRPINARIVSDGYAIDAPSGTNQATFFGWAAGKTNGADDGFGGVQRVGVLNATHYETPSGGVNQDCLDGNVNVDPDGSGPVNAIPFRQRRTKYSGELGFFPCQGDSGAPLLGEWLPGEYLTFGINKGGAWAGATDESGNPLPAAQQFECQRGVVSGTRTASAHRPDGLAIGKLIFEIERVNGFTTLGSATSGRFRCAMKLGARIDFFTYLQCDNSGVVFSEWDDELVSH